MVKILKDIRVIELGTYITGPAAGMHLADLGADVIKVERPGVGDPFRAFKGGLYSPHYQTYNRNKRSIALDTKKPEDLETLHQLVADADVFIQNFRPGVAEKLGAGEEDLRAVNPSLIYCAISGFGRTGPSRDRPAYDTVAQAASGYLRLLTPPTNPRVIGPAIADSVTGQYAAMGIMAALLERAKTGEGRRLDISMLEAMCHFNLDSFTHYYSVGEIMGPLSRPVVSQSYTFECADGKWVAIHMSSPPKFWEGLLQATGQTQLKDDPRFAERLEDPLKRWKLSPIDIKARTRFADYTSAREAMFAATHTDHAPWTVVDYNDQKRGRLTLIRDLLDRLPDMHVPVEPLDWPELDHAPLSEEFALIQPVPSFPLED